MKTPALMKLWTSTPLIATLGAVVILAVSLAVASYSEQTYRTQKAHAIAMQADVLSEIVTAALVFDDATAAQEYVNALRANPQVQMAAIYKSDATLMAGYTRNTQAFPERVNAQKPVFKDGFLIVTVPVIQNGSIIGYVHLQDVVEPAAQKLARYSGFLLLLTMAILLIAVLIIAHGALTRVNRTLATRNVTLNETNRLLRTQIEEREKAEEALRQAQKMEAIGQLSGGIAHDFNNLLTVIKGNLQLLDKRISAGNKDVGRYIDAAMDGVMRAANVTQRILAFSRRQPLSPKAVDLSQLIADVAALLRHSVGGLVNIETRLNSNYLVLCDANQMENVVINLAINARDAMPDGGNLLIETRNIIHDPAASASRDMPDDLAGGEYVHLSVTDTGTGMSDEVREKAIEPFFTTKPVGHGTGLGLSMIFGFVKQSGGYLQIHSEIGHGTRINIFMPRALHGAAQDDAEQKALAAYTIPASPALSDNKMRKCVLIVEDEPLVRALVAETFEEKGFDVVEKGDGQDALDTLKSPAQIDLLLSDVRLPGLNGYQLAGAAMDLRPDIKILLVTGYAQDPAPPEITSAGIDILYKPYRLEDLVAKVNEIMASSSVRPLH